MSDSIVLDASASVELLLNTPRGSALRAKIPRGAVEYVPEHFYVEVSAGIRRVELKGDVTSDRAAVAIDDLLRLRARRVEVRSLLSEAWTLRHNVAMADAIYVVLARQLTAPLITADDRLRRAPGLGIEVIGP